LVSIILNSKAIDAIQDLSNFTSISEDEPIRAICKKRIIDDVPLRCWRNKGNLEIAFHIDCALNESNSEEL